MMISHGALLEEVYGTDISVKKKKKDKKTRNTFQFLPEMEKDLEKEKQKHIFPSQPEDIDGFDKSFGNNTNIMPFSESNFFSLNGKEEVDVGRYSPIPTRKSEEGREVTSNSNNNSNNNSNSNSNSSSK